MKNEITTPVINLHGTGAQRLQDEYIKAMDAVGHAMNEFRNIEFNARDYESFESFEIAKKERNLNFQKLYEVYMDLEKIAESLNVWPESQEIKNCY